MKVSSVLAAAALAAGTNAMAPHQNGTVVTTTITATEFTTYCPYPTKITVGKKTYTVTEATTLTITDCPCVITHTPKPNPQPQPQPNPNPNPQPQPQPNPNPNPNPNPQPQPQPNPNPQPQPTQPPVVPTAAANKVGSAGALIAVGVAALAL